MRISVINVTGGTITDEEIQVAIRGINRQIREDFRLHWGLDGELRLEGAVSSQPNAQSPASMRGQGVIYIWNDVDVADALAYHSVNNLGIPFGVVFAALAAELGETWTTSLSHEALELLADPEVNRLVAGLHPEENREVFYWYEVCDAVQDETYLIDDVEVSNFVLPLYFTPGDEIGGRNDFLAIEYDEGPLRSFGVSPGGYAGFYDPTTGKDVIWARDGDVRAAHRRDVKAKAGLTRRSVRYANRQKAADLTRARGGRGASRRRTPGRPGKPARSAGRKKSPAKKKGSAKKKAGRKPASTKKKQSRG